MIYEHREYIASEGKLEALHNRFKDHTLPLFQKHGINVVGFWTDHENPLKITYICKFSSLEAQRKAWEAFGSDPDWKKVKKDSESNGPLTISMNSVLLNPVEYTSQP